MILCILLVLGGIFWMLKEPVQHFIINPYVTEQSQQEMLERDITADEIQENLSRFGGEEVEEIDDTSDIVIGNNSMEESMYDVNALQVGADGIVYFPDGAIFDAETGVFIGDDGYMYTYDGRLYDPYAYANYQGYVYDPYAGHISNGSQLSLPEQLPYEASYDFTQAPNATGVVSQVLSNIEVPAPISNVELEDVSGEVQSRLTSDYNPANDGLSNDGTYRVGNRTYNTARDTNTGATYPVTNDSNVDYNPSNVQSLSRIPFDARVDYNYVVGEIYMPDVNMHLPIMEGVTNSHLWVGAGTMKPGQQMGRGNYALAGHYMYDKNQLFTPITRASRGQSIYVTDKSHVYEYVVTNVVQVPASRGDLIENSQGDGIITLVTCSDPYGTERVIVRGELKKITSMSRAPSVARDAFVR